MSNGKSAALVGALLGLGLGELAPRERRYGGKNAYVGDNPTGVSGTSDYVDSLLAPQPSAQQAIRRLPPVDEGGQPLDSMPDGPNSGDVRYQALPSMGGDEVDHSQQHPDKFDTITGDALQTQRKARTYRAISDAARINEILGQRSISRQQASGLIRDYHQKYPDINIPIQPYTSQQAAELRNRAVLEQKRDEAESQGFPREIYTNDPKTGSPIVDPVALLGFQHKAKAAEVERQSAHDMAIEQDKREHEARMARATEESNRRANADAAYKTAVQIAPKPPKKPDSLTALPSEMAEYNSLKKEYDDPVTGHNAIVKAARQQYLIDKGYIPANTANEAAPEVPFVPPHAQMPSEAAPVTQQLTANPQELARTAGVPFFATPEEALKALKPGQSFVNPQGKIKKIPEPKAEPQAATNPVDEDIKSIVAGKIPQETALTWHPPETQAKIKKAVAEEKQRAAIGSYIDAQANRIANGQLPIKEAMDELDSGSQISLVDKLKGIEGIDDIARNQRYDSFADAVKKTANINGIKSRLESQLAEREANLKSESIAPEESVQVAKDDPRAIIKKLKAAESETQVATKSPRKKSK